jgi:hypothetical protein
LIDSLICRFLSSGNIMGVPKVRRMCMFRMTGKKWSSPSFFETHNA